MKRLELLMSKESSMEESARFQAEQDKLQLQQDLLVTKQELSQKEQKLKQLKSAEVLVPFKIVSVISDIEALKAGVKALKELEKELF